MRRNKREKWRKRRRISIILLKIWWKRNPVFENPALKTTLPFMKDLSLEVILAIEESLLFSEMAGIGK